MKTLKRSVMMMWLMVVGMRGRIGLYQYDQIDSHGVAVVVVVVVVVAVVELPDLVMVVYWYYQEMCVMDWMA